LLSLLELIPIPNSIISSIGIILSEEIISQAHFLKSELICFFQNSKNEITSDQKLSILNIVENIKSMILEKIETFKEPLFILSHHRKSAIGELIPLILGPKNIKWSVIHEGKRVTVYVDDMESIDSLRQEIYLAMCKYRLSGRLFVSYAPNGTIFTDMKLDSRISSGGPLN
jgi:hypothetical protein